MDKKAVHVELVTYAGKTYRRYPSSKSKSNQVYFRRSRSNSFPEYLHHRVYRDHYGEIQPGFHVHHVDGNPGNNQPENLVCISVKDHVHAHWTPERRAKTKSTAIGYDHLPRHGMPAMKDGPGTVRLPCWPTKALSLSPSNANTAEVISKPGKPDITTFLQQCL